MPAFTSRHRHGGRWWGIGTTAAAAVVALLFVALAGAAKPPSGSPSGPFAVPNGPISVLAGFEGNDANAPAETKPAGSPTNGGGYAINFDWNSLVPTGRTNPAYSGPAPYQHAGTTTGGWQWVALTDDAKSTTDTGFSGGVKQDDSCAAVSGGSAPNKDDLKRAYIAAQTVGGHTYLELAWARIPQNTTSPSAHVAFEFNQGGTACGAGSAGLVARTPGDMLLLYDFTGGSTVPPHVTLSRWISSGTCGVSSHAAPCWGAFTDLELTNPVAAEANVNTGLSHVCNSSITGSCGPNETDVNANTPSQGTTYQLPSSTSDSLAPATETLNASEFGEATVDLTLANVFTASSCTSFGQVEAVSRSSGDSGTAAMEDLVGPGTFTLSNCTTSATTEPQSDGTASTAGTTWTTLTHDAATDTYSGSFASGTWMRDNATVSVTGATTWRGNVAFYLCKNISATLTGCDPNNGTGTTNPTGTTVSTIDSAVAVGQGGTTPPGALATSSNTRVTDAGSYCWAAVFTHSSPTGLPNATATSIECFAATSPTSVATNPFYYPQDRATISASSGGDLAGSVAFRLYDNSTDCNATDNVDTVGTNGLLYKETGVSVAGPSPVSVSTSNTSTRVTATTTTMSWKVTYSSTNPEQTASSSVCVENIADTITADGTVTFP